MAYFAPTALNDALAMIGSEDVNIIAGGTDVFPAQALIYFVFVSTTTVALNKNSQVPLVLILAPRKTSIATSYHSPT